MRFARGLIARFGRSDAARAAGMGGAVVTSNALTLVFTITFARVLGVADYGSLAALMSAFYIVSIGGSALQVAVARAYGRGEEVTAAVRRLMRWLVAATVLSPLVGLVLRAPLAAAVGVDARYAAAAVLPSAALWLIVSLQRGVLQGHQAYRPVALSLIGEAIGRLGFGLVLVAAGLGVTGAFLGTAASLVAVALALSSRTGAVQGAGSGPGGLGEVAAGLVVAGPALALLALLQNVDVIVVKHGASAAAAGSYAAAALVAKAIPWLGVGLAMFLLPEVARRAAAGRDPRRLLVEALGLLLMVGAPLALLAAVAGRPLLTAVFGAQYAPGARVLALLVAAMTLLGATYLAAHYLMALGARAFLWLLLAAAVLEPVLLLSRASDPHAVAVTLTVLQLGLAASMIAWGLGRSALARGVARGDARSIPHTR